MTQHGDTSLPQLNLMEALSEFGLSELIATLAVLVALGAAFVAWIVPHKIEERRQASLVREMKVDCLRRVVGFRAEPPTRDFIIALNEVPVTFNDSPTVTRALVRFTDHVAYRVRGDGQSLLAGLIEAMMDDLGLDRSQLTRDYLLTFLMVSDQI